LKKEYELKEFTAIPIEGTRIMINSVT